MAGRIEKKEKKERTKFIIIEKCYRKRKQKIQFHTKYICFIILNILFLINSIIFTIMNSIISAILGALGGALITYSVVKKNNNKVKMKNVRGKNVAGRDIKK